MMVISALAIMPVTTVLLLIPPLDNNPQAEILKSQQNNNNPKEKIGPAREARQKIFSIFLVVFSAKTLKNGRQKGPFY